MTLLGERPQQGQAAGDERAAIGARLQQDIQEVLGESAGFLTQTTAHVLADLGPPAAEVLARAAAAETGERLAAETEAARALGVFGAPTFAAGNELFWGDDRLEDAIAFASG